MVSIIMTTVLQDDQDYDGNDNNIDNNAYSYRNNTNKKIIMAIIKMTASKQ